MINLTGTGESAKAPCRPRSVPEYIVWLLTTLNIVEGLSQRKESRLTRKSRSPASLLHDPYRKPQTPAPLWYRLKTLPGAVPQHNHWQYPQHKPSVQTYWLNESWSRESSPRTGPQHGLPSGDRWYRTKSHISTSKPGICIQGSELLPGCC